jgi:hypothetical protein
MIKLAHTDTLKQVYSTDRIALVRWLSAWAIKNDVFVNNDWIKSHKDVNGINQYYAEFFGKYYDKVSVDELRQFNEIELLAGIEHKLGGKRK